MNLNKIRPKNETKDLIFSITKNCETLIGETQRKPEETLEFKLTKSTELFHFNPSISIQGDWMIGLASVEIYNSAFNVTEENNKFELYKFPDSKIGDISYEKMRDEIEKELEITDITASDLQDNIIGPFIFKEYKEQLIKTMKDDKYMVILGFYIHSIFQDFKSYLKTEIDLVEEDIILVLDEYNSIFITYELKTSIYAFIGLLEALFNIFQPEYDEFNYVISIGFDDITRKARLVVGPGILAIRFDEKHFFSSVLGFNYGWNYKHFNEYSSQNMVNLATTNKNRLICDGSTVDGLRQPILFSIVLDKPSGKSTL